MTPLQGFGCFVIGLAGGTFALFVKDWFASRGSTNVGPVADTVDTKRRYVIEQMVEAARYRVCCYLEDCKEVEVTEFSGQNAYQRAEAFVKSLNKE